jgi:hypothetical protein
LTFGRSIEAAAPVARIRSGNGSTTPTRSLPNALKNTFVVPSPGSKTATSVSMESARLFRDDPEQRRAIRASGEGPGRGRGSRRRAHATQESGSGTADSSRFTSRRSTVGFVEQGFVTTPSMLV